MNINMPISIIIAVILDFIIGDPYSFPHPVKLMGKIIDFEERQARKIFKTRKGLKFSGFIIIVINMALGFFLPYSLLKLIRGHIIIYNLVNIYLIYTCIAARSLHYEAYKVGEEMKKGLSYGRERLKYIVGRDTSDLDEKEIIEATVETVAENTSDGIIAPLLFIMFLGAPGGLLYKFVNTMDSMLGYMNEKYRDIGYFPAKLDDIFNYIAARITGVLMCLGSVFRFNSRRGFKVMYRDRKNHKSPNAIYPEAAVAGLLGIQLGGDSYYYGELVKKPSIGDRTREIQSLDIKNTVEIMYRTEILLLLIYLILYYFLVF